MANSVRIRKHAQTKEMDRERKKNAKYNQQSTLARKCHKPFINVCIDHFVPK